MYKSMSVKTVVAFKSHYNKTKISEMDISNIFFKKNGSFEIFAKDGVK